MVRGVWDGARLSDVNANPILAQVVRSGALDAVHRGRVAVVDPDGTVELALGDVTAASYPRSATKPLQVIAMLEAGLDVDGALLALASASHSGEDFHLRGVEQLLAGAGLGLDALQNTPDYPLDEESGIEWILGANRASSITQNCSGKHAAMLRTCVRAGWPTASYLDAEHPMQAAITAVVERYTGEPTHIGIDGCGAPAHTMSVVALARVFGQIAASRDGAAHRLAEAMRAHPEYVSGTRRWEYRLHRAVPGLICKFGAEGCVGIGLPNGQGIAIKVDDGADRVLPVIAVEVLGSLGIRSEELTNIGTVPVLGHGRPVGEIVPLLFG